MKIVLAVVLAIQVVVAVVVVGGMSWAGPLAVVAVVALELEVEEAIV
jgi:hypothetical protein